MENGSIGASDAATLALLYNGRGGYGGIGVGGGYGNYMYPGNSMLSADAHANGTAVNAKLDCNHLAATANLDRISDQNMEARRILQSDSIRKDISDNALQNAILNGQNNLSIADRLATMATANAKCCCDTQLLVVKENAATRELINARALQDTQRDLDRCLQEKQTQTIISACHCTPTPSTCL